MESIQRLEIDGKHLTPDSVIKLCEIIKVYHNAPFELNFETDPSTMGLNTTHSQISELSHGTFISSVSVTSKTGPFMISMKTSP